MPNNTFRSLKSYKAVREALENKTITAVALTQYYLQVIEDNKHLNAFLEVFSQEALNQAEAVDLKITNGTAKKCAGMVIGIKDVLAYKDHKLGASSKILEGFVSQYTATAIQRLLDEDAIIIGRLNCDEFGMGGSNENSAYGPVKNAQDNTRVSGGSSGGSAVAVQAGMCLAALGTDTGGSIRQPAAFCGIYGLKPTYGRVSRFGLAAYASSFDTIGPLANNAEDIALMLGVMAGKDGVDSTASQQAVPNYETSIKATAAKNLKIGYLKDGFNTAVNADVRAAYQKTIDAIAAMGHTIEGFDFNYSDSILPTYYILTAAEASSNLSRYDGVKFGYRSPNAKDLFSMYTKTRSEGFGKEVKRRIALGTFVLSANYYDAYFTKAQKVRRLIKDETDALLATYDFLLMPVAPTVAYKIGANTTDKLAQYLGDIFTVQANVTGMPAFSFPVAKDAEGMPIGLQLLAKPFDESSLISFVHNLAL